VSPVYQPEIDHVQIWSLAPTPIATPSISQHEHLRIVPLVEEERTREEYTTLPCLSDLGDLQEREAETTLSRFKEQDDAGAADEQLRIVVGMGLDPGIVRKASPNEDSLFAVQGMYKDDAGSQPTGLFIIADGMGGHANGQVASRATVEVMSSLIAPVLLQEVETDESFEDLLKDGVRLANLAIYRRNQQQKHMMGTTLTSALVVGTTAYIANVGDSRTYLYRPSEGLRQITRDHSVVAQLVEDGLIKREEIYTHPKRNQIYRCLGEHASVDLEMFQESLQPDDILVLCSDGLWEMVRDPDLERIIAFGAPHVAQISSTLVLSALNNGGADNISVVVVGIQGKLA
jgi:serine/threonine protein phosphatase PrpC